ncbi:MAG: GspB domain-containing protein [Steroidobacteraceae bacterium]|nr:GspB domain-containing protein [Steroidobacteraceae bacterium]
MSFILDALKKSEAERQRQIAPGLIETALGRPRATATPLMIVLLALLGVNLIVLSVVLLRRPGKDTVSPPSTTPTAARPTRHAAAEAARSPPPQAQAPVTTTAPSDAPIDDSPVFAPEVPIASTTDNPIVAAAAATAAAATAAAPVASATPQSSDGAILPTIAQLNFTGTDALPPLHLDVHVYSTNPAQRFVFINGHKYTEGSTLREGPTVVRIRPDGVELRYRGRMFLLPRR